MNKKKRSLITNVIFSITIGQILSAVEDQRSLIWWLPAWGEVVWVWGWALLGGLIGSSFLTLLRLELISTAVLLILYGSCFVLLLSGGWIPLVPWVLAGIVTGATLVALDPELNYNWYFLVYCQGKERDKFAYVNGSVRRIESSYLSSSSELFSPQEQFHFYASEGLWYDAVTNLAERMNANPQDVAIKNNWATLLRSVGLEKLARKPFVPCCSLK